MKTKLSIFLLMLSLSVNGQDKYNYVTYNSLLEVTGTEYIVASLENQGKMLATHSRSLLFINTRTGAVRQLDFPGDSWIQKVQQLRIDSLGINKIIVTAQTINLDNSKNIDWGDPKQVIVISPDGAEKTQINEDRLYVRTWAVNRLTGSIVITGHFDSNNNGKYDKTDRNEIMIYDLKTMEVLTRI